MSFRVIIPLRMVSVKNTFKYCRLYFEWMGKECFVSLSKLNRMFETFWAQRWQWLMMIVVVTMMMMIMIVAVMMNFSEIWNFGRHSVFGYVDPWTVCTGDSDCLYCIMQGVGAPKDELERSHVASSGVFLFFYIFKCFFGRSAAFHLDNTISWILLFYFHYPTIIVVLSVPWISNRYYLCFYVFSI